MVSGVRFGSTQFIWIALDDCNHMGVCVASDRCHRLADFEIDGNACLSLMA